MIDKDRYNELALLEENGELAKPENRAQFDELQMFKREAKKNLLIYILNDAKGKTIAESMKAIEQLTPEKKLDIAINNQGIKPNKEAKAYLKAMGVL